MRSVCPFFYLVEKAFIKKKVRTFNIEEIRCSKLEFLHEEKLIFSKETHFSPASMLNGLSEVKQHMLTRW